jgi:hypothetical protein
VIILKDAIYRLLVDIADSQERLDEVKKRMEEPITETEEN